MEKPPLYVARRYTVTPSSGDGIDELRKAFRTTNELRVVWTLPELALRRCAALEERARNSLADLEEITLEQVVGKQKLAGPEVAEWEGLARTVWIEHGPEVDSQAVWRLANSIAKGEVHEQPIMIPAPGQTWAKVEATDDVGEAAIPRLRKAAKYAQIVLLDGGVAGSHPALRIGTGAAASRMIEPVAGFNHGKIAAHGTAAASILVGKGGKQTRGLLQGLDQLPFVGTITKDGRPWQYEAILSALIHLSTWDPNDPTRLIHGPKPGAVILAEMQGAFLPNQGRFADCLAPAELHPPVFRAIRLATRLGVTVIEPAGNSGIHLPLPPERDSGAIVVAAGEQGSTGWSRLDASNFGDRVDCYARGDGLRASGVHRRADNGRRLMSPSIRFTHTSGASAYVAGVAAAIQGWRISQGKPAFGPKALRELLRSGSNDRLDGMGPRVTAEGLLGI